MKLFLTLVIIFETVALGLLSYREVERKFGNDNATVKEFQKEVFALQKSVDENQKFLANIEAQCLNNNNGLREALRRTDILRDQFNQLEEVIPAFPPPESQD
jgi:hypothetical protein